MSSTNGHGPKKAVLYARVSTDEQAKSGYSLRQQVERLGNHAASEGYEVLEEILDAGQSGASLQRPGLDRVRDLVAAGGVSVVFAQDRDRFAREPAYLYLLKQEFGEHGTTIRALNDRGDDSPEGQLTDGILDQLAKFERAKTAERTRRGKMRKVREGKVIAGARPNYGFLYNESRDNYEVDEERMPVIKRIFRMIGAEGQTMHAVKRAFERDGVRPPLGGKHWSPKHIRECIKDDVYRPHTLDEVRRVVTPEVAARLDPSLRYGIWWFNRRRTETKQVSEVGPEGRRYRRRIKVTDKPRSEWIAVPCQTPASPGSGWTPLARPSRTTGARPQTRIASGSTPAGCCSAKNAEIGCRSTPASTTGTGRSSGTSTTAARSASAKALRRAPTTPTTGPPNARRGSGSLCPGSCRTQRGCGLAWRR